MYKCSELCHTTAAATTTLLCIPHEKPSISQTLLAQLIWKLVFCFLHEKWSKKSTSWQDTLSRKPVRICTGSNHNSKVSIAYVFHHGNLRWEFLGYFLPWQFLSMQNVCCLVQYFLKHIIKFALSICWKFVTFVIRNLTPAMLKKRIFF